MSELREHDDAVGPDADAERAVAVFELQRRGDLLVAVGQPPFVVGVDFAGLHAAAEGVFQVETQVLARGVGDHVGPAAVGVADGCSGCKLVAEVVCASR